MTRHIFTFILLSIITSAYSQTTYLINYGGTGNEHVNDIIHTNDGGYLIAGSTGSFGVGLANNYLVKTSPSGDIEWTSVIGRFFESVSQIIQTNDGGYAFIGTNYDAVSGNNFGNFHLVKIDNLGTITWEKEIGGTGTEHGYSIKQTSDSGYIISGLSNSFTPDGSYEFYICKTDSLGNPTWASYAMNTSQDSGKDVFITQDGGYLVIGGGGLSVTQNSFNVNKQALMTKFSSSGVLLWTKAVVDSNRTIDIFGSFQTDDFGYLLTGYENSTGGIGDHNLLVMKLDSNANLIWSTTIDGSDTEIGYDVMQMSNGNITAVGYTESFGAGAQDIFVVQLNSLGNFNWARTIGYAQNDRGSAVAEGNNGVILVGGLQTGFGIGGTDMVVVQLDEFGDAECNMSIMMSVTPQISSISPTEINLSLNYSSIYQAVPIYSNHTTGGSDTVVCRTISDLGEKNVVIEALNIYPNPTNGLVNISFEQLNPSFTIQIIDVNGRILKNHQYKNKQTVQLNIESLPQGFYFIEIKDSHSRIIKKLIKES